MTGAVTPALLEAESLQPRRWLICAAIIAAAHAGLILWLAQRHDIRAAGGPPAAILIDLPPMDAAPAATESPPQPGEEPKAAEANPAPESQKPVVIPELPRAKKPVAVLVPPPKPKPKPAKRKAPQAAATPIQKPAPKTPAAKTGAAKASQAAHGKTPAASRPGEAGSAASAASWRTQIYAHLLSHKPAGGGGAGVVTLSFSLSRSGALLGVHLAASSGSQELDRRALEMVRAANPFPPAPAGLAGGAFPFTVPVRFH